MTGKPTKYRGLPRLPSNLDRSLATLLSAIIHNQRLLIDGVEEEDASATITIPGTGGQTAGSGTGTATAPTTPPSVAPTGSEQVGGGVLFTFPSVPYDYFGRIEVLRSAARESGTASVIGDTPGVAFFDVPPEPGTYYYWSRVVAYDGHTKGVLSGASEVEFTATSDASPDGTSLSLICAADVTRFSVVRLSDTQQVSEATNATVTHADEVVGIAMAGGAAGDLIEVRTAGLVENEDWAWTVGQRVYLGTNGSLTQTIPTSGFVLPLGTTVSAAEIDVRIGTPLVLT